MNVRRLWWAVLVGSAIQMAMCAYAYHLHASAIFVTLGGLFAAFFVRAVGVLRRTRKVKPGVVA